MQTLKHLFLAGWIAAALPLVSATNGQAGTRADAACVQSYLNYFGFNAGEIDGRIGRQTRGAFKRAMEDGIRFDRPSLQLSGADEACELLARKVAAERDNPDILYVLDVPYNSATMVNIDVGIRAAREKLASKKKVTVYAFRDRKRLFSKFREISHANARQAEQFWSRVVGLANGEHIFLDLGKMKGSRHERFVAAHEYAHVHQHASLGRKQKIRKDGISIDGPTWLFEGAAVHLALSINDGILHGSGKPVPDLASLARYREFQNYKDGAGAYSLSWRAAMFLASRTSSETIWSRYWEIRSEEPAKVPWEKTFEKVFGMKVGAVYKVFGMPD